MNSYLPLRRKSKYIFVFLKTFLLFCRFLSRYYSAGGNMKERHYEFTNCSSSWFLVAAISTLAMPCYLILFVKDYIHEKKSENDVDNK